jgi:uncharacterized membrane protein (UPF0136 family)
MLVILRFLWFVFRSRNTPPAVQPLALYSLITYASYLLIATFSGGMFFAETIWLLILLVTALHHFQTREPLPESRPFAVVSLTPERAR